MNPTGTLDYEGTKIMRKTGSYPSGPTDGVQIYDGTGTSTMDAGLSNGVTYYYKAFAYGAFSVASLPACQHKTLALSNSLRLKCIMITFTL